MYHFDIAPIVWQRLAYKGVLSFKKFLFYSIQVRQDASSNDKWRSEIVEASNHKRMSCSWIHVPEKCNCCIARFQWDYSFSAYAKYSRKLTFLTPLCVSGSKNVFKNGTSKICGRQPKKLRWYGSAKQTISSNIFERLSSTNFAWSILKYFVLNDSFSENITYILNEWSLFRYQECFG